MTDALPEYHRIMNAPLVSGSQNPQEVEDSRIAKLREARRAARAARESFQIDDNGGENGERRPSTSNTGVALQNASQVQYQVCLLDGC